MSDSIFDLALEKRFTDSPEAVLVDITPADLMLIRNNETGVILRLPFSVLAAAISGALTGYMKSANNLSDVENAGTARTNLGATTLGGNLFTLPNPGAVRFPRFNADNTVSALDAASFRAAIGAGTSSTTGTVTSVGLSAPTGFTVSGSPVTGSGTLSFSFTAGYSLPSNTAQAAWDAKEPGIPAGTASQYWRGDKSWQTLNKSAVGLGNVDNTSDAQKNSAAATLTNKTLSAPVLSGDVTHTGRDYTSTGTFLIAANGTTTFTVSGLNSASRYLVGCYAQGSNMVLNLLGVVVTGDSNNIISQCATLVAGDYWMGSLTLRNFNELGGFTYSEGNGNKFQFVATGDGGADRTATYFIWRIF